MSSTRRNSSRSRRSALAVAAILALAAVALMAPGTGAGSATRSLPAPVAPDVAAGQFDSLAVKSDGTLWVWGGNMYYQLGLGDTTPREIPEQLGSATDWAQVEIGWGSPAVLALKQDGTMWSWGSNSGNQLGLGFVADQSTPQHVTAAGDSWAKIAVGGVAAAAIKQDGSLYAWGSNDKGAMGSGATLASPTPIHIGSDTWKDVALGDRYIFAVRDDGTLWSAGANDNGQLAQGTADTADHLSLAQVGSRTDWESVAAGYATSYAIRTDGSLWGCGHNYIGSLGDGTEIERHSLVRIGTDSDWASVEAANNYACGLKTDKSLWAWGLNSYGEVGTSAIGTSYKTPRRIGILNTWVAAEAGPYHLLALTDTDTFGTCGDNGYGQTGIGYAYYRSRPEQIGSVGGWSSVDAGLAHSGGIRSDGTLWTWGRDSSGELGRGLASSSSVTAPVQVGTGTWSAVACGDNTDAGFSLGVKGDGTLWSWGDNSSWQLGLGDNDSRFSPEQVGTRTDWAAVAASDGVGDIGRGLWGAGDLIDFSMARTSSGQLFAWGDNRRGQLGQGSTSTIHTRVEVPCPESPGYWTQMAVGDDYTLGISDKGNLYSWGGNVNAQLGLGYKSLATSPLTVPTSVAGAGWIRIACGSGREGSHSAGIQEGSTPGQGTLWVWGDNSTGQLGLGTATSSDTPVVSPTKVGSDTDWVAVAAGSSWGDDYTMAMKADGSIWIAGGNYHGQLGQYDYIARYTFTRVTQAFYPAGTTPPSMVFATVAAGQNPFAIMDDGTLWGWGNNSWGQVGVGDPKGVPAGDVFAIMDFVDTTPPEIVEVAGGLPVSSNRALAPRSGGWSRKAVTVSFKATDPGANTASGAGVSRVQYSVTNGVSWKVGKSVRITKNGETLVKIRALDRVRNVSGEVTRTVKIDTVRPKGSALSAASVRRGKTATLRYKVTDIKAMPKCVVTIRIRNAAGKVVKTLRLGQKVTNTSLSATFRCSLAKGRYRFTVYATDLAGNTQSSAGSNRLTVK